MKHFKNLLSVILCVCILLSTLVPALAVENTDTTPETAILYGDADTDGDVDMQDLLLLEKHIADKNVKISEKHADVNADGYINDADVQMLRDYLVGNINSLTPDLVTVSFVTDGGGEFEPMQVGRGYGIVKELPTPAKNEYIFTGWKKSDGSEFYKEDAINEDITLVAQYEKIEKQEEVNIDSFALTGCSADVTFKVESSEYTNADEVKANIKLLPKDGSNMVEVMVKETEDGNYTIGAANSFTPGSSYELTLGEGLKFVDKENEIRTVNFVIAKAEGDKLYYKDSVIFIEDTDEMKYNIDGVEGEQDKLEVALLNNENKDVVKGTFNMSHLLLNKDDIVCIYVEYDPRERDYTKDENNAYDDCPLAYIRITDVNGSIYSFESLGDDGVKEVLMMPDSIPFEVSVLPEGAKGVVNKDDFDTYARIKLGLTNAPEYNKGDFLIFYTCDFDDITEDTPVVYGQVVGTIGEEVHYEVVTKEYIDNFMGMFVQNDVQKEKILENIDEEELLNRVKEQAENSDFPIEAAGYMLQSAMEQENVQEAMLETGMTEEELNYYATAKDVFLAPTGIPRTKVAIEGISIHPELIKGKRFDDGVGVSLEVHVVLSVDTNMGSNDHSLKIDLCSYFEQEVEIGFDVNVEDEWDYYLVIPVLKELSCYTSIDIKSYSAVSVSASLYTIKEASVAKWKKYKERINANPKNFRMIRNYDELARKARLVANGTQTWNDIQEQMGYLEASLPSVTVDGKTYGFSEIREELGFENVDTMFSENFGSETDKDARVSMQRLMDRYSELLENESDWVNIISLELFDKDFHIKVVAINLTIKLVISANVNLSLGADLEYQTGKRYNFWIHCVSCRAGSSEMDILDERFAYQLYVMGTIGLRLGVKFEATIGLFSTKLGSIGANVEFGPYLKLWGYCCYVYTKHRPANTDKWDIKEEMSGAMHLEFGLYVVVRFKAQAFDGIFKYEPVLYEGEFPLISIGEIHNVYDFANDIEDESLRIVDYDNYNANGIKMEIPQSYRLMKGINVQTGEQFQSVYEPTDFKFTSLSRYFRVNDEGMVTVEAPANAEYLTGEITLTWKNSKLGFSKFDIAITIPVYWTKLTDEQIDEKHTATVSVGNPVDGYTTVWSGKFTRLDSFNLPSEKEILELIKYDSYNDSNDENMRYGAVKGYTVPSTGLTIKEDTNYYFDIERQKYTINVNGVQNIDGSKTTRTYYAFYGDTVSFKDLKDTGANNPETSDYTIFSNVYKDTDEGQVVFENEVKIDMNFAEKYGRTAELEANYSDYSATATYVFEGINAPDVEIVFRKGSTPYYEDILEHVEKHGGAGTTIEAISPEPSETEYSVKYVVTCKKSVPTPKYTLTFDTLGGSKIKAKEYPEGSKLFVPNPPTREGYEFGGWFTDKACTEKFDFKVMPSKDTTIYAKWNPKAYTVTYLILDNNSFTKTVYYDAPIDLTPAENSATQRFLYWTLNGEIVSEGTIFTGSSDITLVAEWALKDKLSIKPEKQHNPNVCEQAYKVVLDSDYQNMDSSIDFVVQYKRNNSNEEYSYTVPSQKGAYDVLITRETDAYYQAFREELSGALIIGKIDLSLSDPNVYVKGNTLVISRPNGYIGDGEITYTAIRRKTFFWKEKIYTNNTGVFNNVDLGSYDCYVTVSSGTYYEGATTNTVSTSVGLLKTTTDDFSYSVDVKTSSDGGTYNDAYVRLAYTDGSTSGWVDLDDPDKGSTISRDVSSSVYPWQLKGASVKLERYLAYYDDEWCCEYVNINTKRGHNTVSDRVYFNWWLGPGDSKNSYNYDIFKRELKIKYEDEKYFNGVDNVVLYGDKPTESYLYDYSGEICDQYYVDGYHPMEVYSPPTFSVTTSNDDLLRYVQYTDVTSFKLDLDGLREYVETKGQQSFDYTVTYSFPSDTCTTSAFSKTIHVDTNKLTNKSVSLYATGSSQNGYTVMADKVDATPGETVNIPVKLQGSTPIWGILANVEFDTDVLDFLGFENDGVFTPAEFTTQDDLTKSSFKFLAANDELENVTAEGTLINLKFKVKENVPSHAYNINVDVIQSVNVDGIENAVDVSNGWINVMEPTTAPVTTEPTEPTTKATEPVVTEPTTVPITTEPTEPTTKATEPVVTEPTTVPITTEPTEPTTKATEPTVTEPSKPKEEPTEGVTQKPTEKASEQTTTKTPSSTIPSGDRNITVNMLIVFIAFCSVGVFVFLRKRKS